MYATRPKSGGPGCFAVRKENEMISGFSHVGLYTADMESAIRFYTEVFAAENLGCFMTERRSCWLRLGRDVLEVFESQELPDGCFRHIALECDDVDGTFDKALRFGAQPLVLPKEITLKLAQPVSARIAFVRGVCGEQIELFCKHGVSL